jgi:hypothetical protein
MIAEAMILALSIRSPFGVHVFPNKSVFQDFILDFVLDFTNLQISWNWVDNFGSCFLGLKF